MKTEISLTNSDTMNTGGNLYNAYHSIFSLGSNSMSQACDGDEGMQGTNTSNPFTGFGGSIASLSTQRYTDQISMFPTTEFVNDNNNGQTYLSVEAYNNAPMSLQQYNLRQDTSGPESQMGLDSDASYTNTTRDLQQASDNFQSSGIQGEGYGTNGSDLFEYQSNFFLGCGGNIASLSSQRYTDEIPMMPTTGFFNSGTDNNNNNDHFDLSTEASNSSEPFGFGNPYGAVTYVEMMTNSEINSPASFQYVSRTSSSLSHQQCNSFQQDRVLKTEPQWTIKKKLTKTDVAYTFCRLYLEKKSIKEDILKAFCEEDGQKLVSNDPQITVTVYDHDTDTTHKLCLAFQKRYVLLKTGWKNHFIRRRNLNQGDEIGLFWDSTASKLHFCVLSRALNKGRLGSSRMIPTPAIFSNSGEAYWSFGTEKSQQADEVMQGEGYDTNNSDLFKYQSNFFLGSGENIASLSSQGYDKMPMLPTTGFVNNDSNNDHFYLNTEASNQCGGYAQNNVEPFGFGDSYDAVASVEMMTNPENTNPASFQYVSRTSSSLEHRVSMKVLQWPITKKLTKTDTDYLSNKLYLEKKSVKEHILKHLCEEDCQKIVSKGPGVTVEVYDHDTDTTQELCLAVQKIYCLKGGWWNHFIKRRELKEGDKIGLVWDCSASKLQFSVLSRAT